jgi:hypothetical protein
MKAGPYIRGQIQSDLFWAMKCEEEAQKLRKRADELIEQAARHRAGAERWAAGTDVSLPPTESKAL